MDIGAETIKVVIVSDNKVIASNIMESGLDRKKTSEQALDKALEKAALSREDITAIVATGSGANEVSYAQESVSEDTADIRGISFLQPNVRTIIDIGAEEARCIQCDHLGRVTGFAKNDKCAAGVGVFIEAMARALETPLEEMGPMSLKSTQNVPLNVVCVVFAESEVISLIHDKIPKADIIHAIHDAIATRTTSMVLRVGVKKDIVCIGGVARNIGVVESLRKHLNTDLLVPDEPQIVGALGAALIAQGYKERPSPVRVIGSAIATQKYSRTPVYERGHTERAGIEARKMAGVDVKDIDMTQVDYWRWTECIWQSDKDWRGNDIIVAGVDVGSVSTQAVILTDRDIYAYSNMRTGSNSPESAKKAMDAALNGTGMTLADIKYVVGTGYGRVNVPFAKRTITEITCHARGAHYMKSSVRTILDMGGQDCKVVHCDEQGKATLFLMNDKCAAGTGRGMETIADLLAVPITGVGELSLQSDKQPPPISSTCVIFAKTEAIKLLRDGWTKPQVLAAYCAAMAHRTAILVQRQGVIEEFAITGGIAKNIGIVSRIEKELRVKAVELKPDPQIAGALGAAVLARDFLIKASVGK